MDTKLALFDKQVSPAEEPAKKFLLPPQPIQVGTLLKIPGVRSAIDGEPILRSAFLDSQGEIQSWGA